MRQRIPELDYMRGIAMLFVIMGHVMLWGIQKHSSCLMGLLALVHLPVFFAVSGFLTYKDGDAPSIRGALAVLAKRSRLLLVPMVVWSVIYSIATNDITLTQSLIYRGRYWFFLGLWWCDVLNAQLMYLSRRYRFGLPADLALYGAAFVLLVVCRKAGVELGGWLPIQNVQYYFPMFAMGLLIKKYECVRRVVFNPWTFAVALFVFLIGWRLLYLENYYIFSCAAFGAVVVVWTACRALPGDAPLVRCLALVGRNTLPIYAIHYLFIAPLPASFLAMTNVPLPFFFEAVITGIYAVVIVAFCLAANWVISMSPVTRCIFYGETPRKKR